MRDGTTNLDVGESHWLSPLIRYPIRQRQHHRVDLFFGLHFVADAEFRRAAHDWRAPCSQTCSGTIDFPAVLARISSTPTPGARCLSTCLNWLFDRRRDRLRLCCHREGRASHESRRRSLPG